MSCRREGLAGTVVVQINDEMMHWRGWYVCGFVEGLGCWLWLVQPSHRRGSGGAVDGVA